MHFGLWVEGSLFSGGVDAGSRKWKTEKRMKRIDVGGELKRPHGMPEALPGCWGGAVTGVRVRE